MSLVNLVVLVVIGVMTMGSYYWLVAQMLPAEMKAFHFPPQSLDDVRGIVGVLRQLQDEIAKHTQYPQLIVMATYSLGYLIKQAFAIPGSAIMNILGGAAFGHFGAWILISFLTASGSGLCFGLSKLFLGDVMEWLRHRYPSMDRIRTRISDGSGTDVLLYMISLRAFPFTPNWLLNIALPHMVSLCFSIA
jgi:uncharacterized membrane protein YdjX (TVP38/TMEM64 family)